MNTTERTPAPAGRRNACLALDSRFSTLDLPRSGFTLVELLVVIAVIAFLAAVLGVVLGNMAQQARQAATNATIKKIHVLLDQRLEAFDRQIDRIENSSRLDRDYESVKSRVDPTLPAEQIRILTRKLLKKAQFPQTFADTGDVNNNGTFDVLDLITADPQSSFNVGNHVLLTESSEMLFYMLTRMEVGGAPPVDAGEFLSSELADTDKDGLLEFIDGWGQPLRFYRWPTRLFKPLGICIKTDETPHRDHNELLAGLLIQGLPSHDPVNGDLLDTDPDDPLELLNSWINDYFESNFHTRNTYHLPLIVSAGPDGNLGLREPHEREVDNNIFGYLAQPDGDVTDAIHLERIITELSDNVTNRNQRTGE